MILEMSISLVWIDQNRFFFFSLSELLKPNYHKNATSLKMERSDVENNCVTQNNGGKLWQ